MSLQNKIITITLFGIGMAFMESAVVIYMREILYPDGFQFPLSPIPVELAVTELIREISTMVMLITVAILAARRFSTGFGWFLYTFAVWDIFYYVFLWSLLGWPESIMTWDILFLIPTTWTGPVLSPVLVSLTMILLAMAILTQAEKGKDTRIPGYIWTGLIVGSLVLILGFVSDYSRHMLIYFTVFGMLEVKNPEVLEVATRYIPERFPWWIFAIGELIILTFIGLYYRRLNRSLPG